MFTENIHTKYTYKHKSCQDFSFVIKYNMHLYLYARLSGITPI